MTSHKKIWLSYPIDVVAERSYIAAFLTGNYRMVMAHALSCSFFYAPEHKIIIYAIMELDAEHIRISRKELVLQLERTGEMSSAVKNALDAVTDELIPEDRMKIVRGRLIDCYTGRALIHRMENTTLWLADGDINYEKFLLWTHDAIVELNEGVVPHR